MPVELYRVDNRLIHGQVLEAWVPRVRAQAILVVDATSSGDPFQRCVLEAMGQDVIHVCVVDPAGAIEALKTDLKDKRVIVLFKTVEQALAASKAGLAIDRLNLGNIHPSGDTVSVTPSVNLSPEDTELLKELAARGVKIEARAVPCEDAMDVNGYCERYAS